MKRRNLLKVFLIPIVFGFGLTSISAQFKNLDIEELCEQYPNQNFLQLTDDFSYRLFYNNGNFKGEQHTTERYIFLNNKMKFYNKAIFSNWNNELLDFEVNIYTPLKNKYKKKQVKDFEEIKMPYSWVFYDDLKLLNFAFNGLQKGSIVEIISKHKVQDPRLLSLFYFQGDLPIVNMSFEVISDKGIDIQFYKENISTQNLRYNYYQNENNSRHVWQASNVDPIAKENDQPSTKYFVPHIIPVIRFLNDKNNSQPVLASQNDLYNWYQSFVYDIENEDIETTRLVEISNSVCADCTSDFEKVRNLYQWVQENITYIAFEYATDGYIPTPADVTLKNRYGDCKDKSLLLHEMLKSVSVKSNMTWIGTRDIPYSYSEIASPHTDNHMILTYIDDDTYYFLDPTGKYQPIDMPTSFIQGKEALIAIDKDSFQIQTVPILNSLSNQFSDTIEMTIDSDVLQGSGTSIQKGYPKISFNNYLLRANKKEVDEKLKDILKKGNNKFKLLSVSEPDLANYSKTILLDYQFQIPDHIKIYGDELYVNMNLRKEMENLKLDKDRKTPFFIDYCVNYSYCFSLSIPEGYSLEFLPEEKSYESPGLRYKCQYTKEDSCITYSLTINIDELIIENARFNDWNNLIDSLRKTYSETVIFKKI